ncbi:type II toxin-antitoxin system RelE/ParE family toxin [Lichenicoccus sp.]|uniref:type II toxin-antitoxin system RelE/ParE family toxin n=1 Tax=Lichenicoccus sp. TaxID=2781899 RepID=UPI003D0C831E
MSIQSFRDRVTGEVLQTGTSREHGNIATVAFRKLNMLDAAVELFDLRRAPGNRLEALKGNCQGQHSIRINDQFRICFVWTSAGPTEVEITDYH